MQNEIKKNQAPISAMDPVARRHARQYLLQALYLWHINHTPICDIEKDFIAHQIKKPTDLPYFQELLKNITLDTNTLNSHIKPLLNRAFSEVDTIELSVLQIAIYELINRLDVPYRVVINEALELTKKFGSVEGFKFVNGILDKVSKNIRATEIESGKK